MSFAEEYAAKCEDVRQTITERLRSATSPASGSKFIAQCELVRTNLLHIAGITDRETNNALVTKIAVEHAITSDVDHTPAFLPELTDHIRLWDPTNVLSRVEYGENFLFAGFHTGPYWSLPQTLCRMDTNVAIAVPPTAQKDEIMATFRACVARSGARTQVELLDISDKSFFGKLKEAAASRHQIVIYPDGYGGHLAKPNASRDAFMPFLACELRVKTNVVRLAEMLRIPIVCFNARRSTYPDRDLYIDAEFETSTPSTTRETDAAYITELLFQKLAGRVVLAPDQWEGWYYFHVFFSDRFLNSLRVRFSHFKDPDWKASDRYFQDSRDDRRVLIDRFTYAAYKLRDKNVASATPVAE